MWKQQKDAILACILLIFIEPFEILGLFFNLFYNTMAYLWYNVAYLWRIIDATFGFTRDGVLTALR